HLAELDALGLDFYHLSENVHRARRKVFGEEAPEGRAWADDLMHVFKHEGYSAAWEKIIQWRAALKGKAKREPADRLVNFVTTRKEMIRYPNFRERGWQIGSGPTESANGNKSGQRLAPSPFRVARKFGHARRSSAVDNAILC